MWEMAKPSGWPSCPGETGSAWLLLAVLVTPTLVVGPIWFLSPLAEEWSQTRGCRYGMGDEVTLTKSKSLEERPCSTSSKTKQPPDCRGIKRRVQGFLAFP